MLWPWTLSSQNGIVHGCRHGVAMDALFSEQIKRRTSSCFGHGRSLLKTEPSMDVVMVWPWMLSAPNGLDHGCHRA